MLTIANAALGGWTFINPTPNQTLSTVSPVQADGDAANQSITLTLVVKSSGNNPEGTGGPFGTTGWWTITWAGSATPSPGAPNFGAWPAGIHHIVLYEGTTWRAEQYINFN